MNLTSGSPALRRKAPARQEIGCAPLRHIDGFVRVLEEDFAAGLPAGAVRYLSLVRAVSAAGTA